MRKRRKALAYGLLTVVLVVIGLKIYLKGFSEIDDKVLGEALRFFEEAEGREGGSEGVSDVGSLISSYLGVDWTLPSRYVVSRFSVRKMRGTRIIFLVLESGDDRLVMAIYRVKPGGGRGFLGTANQIYGERGGYSFYMSEGRGDVKIALIGEMDVNSLYRLARRDFFLSD